jgi:hypothetical protein
MTDQNDEQRFQKWAIDVYSKLPGNRAYALTDDSALALTALLQSWRDSGNSVADADDGRAKFGELLVELGKFAPTLFQEQASEPKPLPTPWKNPLTGAPLPNPFAKESFNLTWQKMIMKRDPDLAEHLRRSAADPWQYVVELRDEAAKAERLKAMVYTEEDHANNPFVRGSKAYGDLKAQGNLDPLKAELYKREARPVELPFTNLTARGQMKSKAPALFELTERARDRKHREIERALAESKAAELAAAEKSRALQAAIERGQSKLGKGRPVGELV